jgi:hypothetical protein
MKYKADENRSVQSCQALLPYGLMDELHPALDSVQSRLWQPAAGGTGQRLAKPIVLRGAGLQVSKTPGPLAETANFLLIVGLSN